jgi:hypothetical protein
MTNDGGIKRGDSMETGDNQARPTDGVGLDGSGVRAGDDGPAGMPTFDPSSEEEPTSVDETFDAADQIPSGGIDELTILSADDPSLGLTDIGDVPPDDWAADTGPTQVPTPDGGIATKYQTDRSSTLNRKR